jgi:hypothetical protein
MTIKPLFTMKKLSIIFSLLFAITFTAQQAQAQVKFGIRGGANFANLYDFSSNLVGQSRTGFLVGAYLQLPVGNNFTFQPELLYTTKGFKAKIPAPPPVFPKKVTKTVHYNYISVPLLLKYKFTPQKALSPYVAVGPYFAFLINDKLIKNGETMAENTGNIRQYDIGASIGAGLEYHGFNFGVRYSMGFVPIGESKSVNEKNSDFSIVAGFTF